MTRALLLAALLLPGAACAREWSFRVTLDGLPIGTHRFTLQEAGDVRHLLSDARFRVRLLFVNAYRYEHRADETWKGDCLVGLASRTVEQGRTTEVSSHEDGDLVLDGPAGRARAQGCPMTFAYWNPRILEQAALINPQTGAITPVVVRRAGRERLDVRGETVEATHYSLRTDKTAIDVYYAPDGDWVGLRSTTHEGHVLRYRLE